MKTKLKKKSVIKKIIIHTQWPADTACSHLERHAQERSLPLPQRSCWPHTCRQVLLRPQALLGACLNPSRGAAGCGMGERATGVDRIFLNQGKILCKVPLISPVLKAKLRALLINEFHSYSPEISCYFICKSFTPRY